jgi:D-alanyl-D-alanine carboxypeptidase/D-alanyl-D-alanine-endopeptidase (penicillin-binding protein 4)
MLVAIILLTSSASADEAQATDALETIQRKVAQYLKRPGVRSANWGIQILDPEDNKVLVEVNPDKAFLPASVLKVVTTAAAVEKLGPDFRYRTGVYSNGTVDEDGVLDGDLILVGRGDPNLMDAYGDLQQSPALQDLAEKIAALGIREVKGDIVGDDSYFDPNDNGKGWTASELGKRYGAPVTALSINNNVIQVTASPTKYKKKVAVSLEPKTSYFRISNQALTGGRNAKRTLRVTLQRASNTLVITGVLPATKTVTQAVVLAKPAETTAAIFKDELERREVAVRGGVRAVHYGDELEDVTAERKLLAEHQSLPLVKALEIINKRSQNLHAEMLLRTLGAEFRGVGTNEAGLQAVKAFLVEAGIDSEKIKLDDGCGLSRENFLTPRFQTSLLEYLFNRPYFSLFFNTLAVSGTDGTLKNRLAALDVKGSVHAKTGTLNGVTTLSGYITTQSGKNLAFCIFANSVTATAKVKQTIDEICSLFVKSY